MRAVLRRAKKTTEADDVDDLRPHITPDGTVTILFSDIEGFTHMTERLGDQRAQQVLRVHNDIVRHQVAVHGGFEVKTLGDGFMLAFSSARRALQCSIAIQRAFAAHNESHIDEAVNVRIGLHTGEPVQEMEDFFGKGVILASRIAHQARGGQIFVSSLLKELTESTGDIQFGEGQESSGPHHQDSGEAKIRESTAGVSRKPSYDCKACGCSSKHLCGLTAWNT